MSKKVDVQYLLDRLEKEHYFKFEKCSENEVTEQQRQNRIERSKGFLEAMGILKEEIKNE